MAGANDNGADDRPSLSVRREGEVWRCIRLLAFRSACALAVIVGVYVAAQFAEARHAGWVAAGVGLPLAVVAALLLRTAPEPPVLRGPMPHPAAPPRLTILLPMAGLLFLLVLLPVLVTRLPPDDDYPNYLARIHVMVLRGRDPLLAQFYGIQWHVIPNLGMELVLPWLAAATSIFLAGKVFFVVCSLLLMSGPHAIHWALYRQLSFGPLVAVLFVYNGVSKMGILNYQFGIGLAMFALAAWIALRPAHPLLRAAVSACCVAILFFCHFAALGFYGVAIGSFELWYWWSQPHAHRTPATDAVVLIAPFLIALLLLLLGPARQGAYATPFVWGGIHARIDGIRFLLETYSPRFDLIAMLLISAALVVAIGRNILHLHSFGWVLLAVAGIVYLAVPNQIAGGWGAAVRLPLAVLLVVIGALHWDLRTAVTRTGFLVVLGLLALFRTASVGAAFQHYGRIDSDFEASLRLIPPGSRILVADGSVTAPDALSGAIQELPLLAVIERSCMVSLLYSHPLQQILVVKPPYRASAGGFDDQPIPLAALLAPPRGFPLDQEPLYDPSGRIYWSDWVHTYDYVYVIDRPEPTSPAPDRLVLLHRGERFELFRIVMPGASPS